MSCGFWAMLTKGREGQHLWAEVQTGCLLLHRSE